MRRTSLIAASLASAPELAKKTRPPGGTGGRAALPKGGPGGWGGPAGGGAGGGVPLGGRRGGGLGGVGPPEKAQDPFGQLKLALVQEQVGCVRDGGHLAADRLDDGRMSV